MFRTAVAEALEVLVVDGNGRSTELIRVNDRRGRVVRVLPGIEREGFIVPNSRPHVHVTDLPPAEILLQALVRIPKRCTSLVGPRAALPNSNPTVSDHVPPALLEGIGSNWALPDLNLELGNPELEHDPSPFRWRM